MQFWMNFWATHQYFLFSCQFAFFCRQDQEGFSRSSIFLLLLFCWSSFVISMQLFVFLFTTSYLLTDLQCHDCKAVSRHCWLNCFEGQWSRERSTTSNFSKSFLREIFMLISLIMKHYIFLQSSIRINEIANFNPNIKTAIKRKMGQFQRGN